MQENKFYVRFGRDKTDSRFGIRLLLGYSSEETSHLHCGTCTPGPIIELARKQSSRYTSARVCMATIT